MFVVGIDFADGTAAVVAVVADHTWRRLWIEPTTLLLLIFHLLQSPRLHLRSSIGWHFASLLNNRQQCNTISVGDVKGWKVTWDLCHRRYCVCLSLLLLRTTSYCCTSMNWITLSCEQRVCLDHSRQRLVYVYAHAHAHAYDLLYTYTYVTLHELACSLAQQMRDTWWRLSFVEVASSKKTRSLTHFRMSAHFPFPLCSVACNPRTPS